MFERELLDADNEANNEPLHVYLTANSDEHLEVGEAMIQAILRQTEEGKNWALMTYDHSAVKRVWCENCGQQGHKFFQCPEKILSNKTNVVCQICFATSHPTNDCPKKHGMRAIGGLASAGLHGRQREARKGRGGHAIRETCVWEGVCVGWTYWVRW